MSEFAACLGRAPEKIQAWLDDQDIPRPYELSMILITLTESAVPNREPVLAMSRKRATNVSPHGARMLPTVAQAQCLLEKYPE